MSSLHVVSCYSGEEASGMGHKLHLLMAPYPLYFPQVIESGHDEDRLQCDENRITDEDAVCLQAQAACDIEQILRASTMREDAERNEQQAACADEFHGFKNDASVPQFGVREEVQYGY